MSNCDWWKIKWNIKSGAEYLYSEAAVHIVQRAIFIFFQKKEKKREIWVRDWATSHQLWNSYDNSFF